MEENEKDRSVRERARRKVLKKEIRRRAKERNMEVELEQALAEAKFAHEYFREDPEKRPGYHVGRMVEARIRVTKCMSKSLKFFHGFEELRDDPESVAHFLFDQFMVRKMLHVDDNFDEFNRLDVLDALYS